jgi:O-phosphoseryl-tRNA(Cys) synthetase
MEEQKTPKKRINRSCIMEEKIDRLENHFKVYKTDMVDVKDSVRNIESALIGSDYNNHKGMVHLLDDVHIRVQKLEDKQLLQNDFIGNIKWFQRGLIGIIFSYIIWLITNK